MMLEKISMLGKTLSKKKQCAILGGNVDELSPGTGSCAAFRPCRQPGPHDDTCEGGKLEKNMSKADAQAYVSNGGSWCCESCSDASWYY